MPLLLEGRRFSAFWLRRAEARGVLWPLEVLADGDEVGKCNGDEAETTICNKKGEQYSTTKVSIDANDEHRSLDGLTS